MWFRMIFFVYFYRLNIFRQYQYVYYNGPNFFVYTYVAKHPIVFECTRQAVHHFINLFRNRKTNEQKKRRRF